jgi:hypothetical protein
MPILQEATSAVMEGFPEAGGNHIKRFPKPTEGENFLRI